MNWMNWKTWTTVALILIAVAAIYVFAADLRTEEPVRAPLKIAQQIMMAAAEESAASFNWPLRPW